MIQRLGMAIPKMKCNYHHYILCSKRVIIHFPNTYTKNTILKLCSNETKENMITLGKKV